MRWIPIGPANRLRSFVVVPNVATNLPCEVGDRREDPACEQLPLDLRKPELDLIQPRRVRRREVDLHMRMREQERPDRLRLVRGEIVRNDVNLAALRLTVDDVAEELDERRARVARDRLAKHLARLRIERREQRERAVAVVLKSVALR